MKNRRWTHKAWVAGAALALAGGLVLVHEYVYAVGRQCTVSSGTSPTGRAWGLIEPTAKDPTICLRRRLGGTAPPGFPSCHEVGRVDLGCVTIIDVP